MSRLLLVLGVVSGTILVTTLAACNGGRPPSLNEQYLQRLSNPLNVDLSTITVDEPLLPPYPRSRALTMAVPTLSIDVAQFAALHACDLGDLAASRSSSLGRVAGLTTLLAQDQRWVRQAPACAGQGVAWLDEVLVAKQAALPRRFWNAVFAGPEFVRLMSLSRLPSAEPGLLLPDQSLRSLLDAWRQLKSARLDLATLNASLQQLGAGEGFGVLRKEWQAQRVTLTRAADGLRRQAGVICRNGQPTPKAQVLRRVFERYYRDGIQPQLARDYAAQRGSIAAFAQLQTELRRALAPTEVPEALTAWYQRVLDPNAAQSEWRRTQAAIQDHAAAWQVLWETCGMPLAPVPP